MFGLPERELIIITREFEIDLINVHVRTVKLLGERKKIFLLENTLLKKSFSIVSSLPS